MNNMVKQMILTARAENAQARKRWGGVARTLGGHGRKIVLPPKAEQIGKLLDEGMSRRDVANTMGVTYQTVTSYMDRYNLGTGA
jgi:DNA invertase Pin-like site-specific DNA recombinase|tara:strand:+ start:70 stop:321 length:252 start_codon:yes stop_codon:yes gene_type:complete